MGLFSTHVYNRVSTSTNVNINLKDLKKPLEDIKEAIVDSNDKLIEAQKEKFIEINGITFKASLIEAVTEIKDNKFSVIFSPQSRMDTMDFENDDLLSLRTTYNKIAKIIGIELNGSACACGKTTEKISLDSSIRDRFDIFDDFLVWCPDCRKKLMLEEQLYRKFEDYSVGLGRYKIIFLDGQEEIIEDNPYELRSRYRDIPEGIL